MKRTWKVYGLDNHRQRESFNKSYVYDFSKDDKVRIIEVENSDKTGTNMYSIVTITRNTYDECEDELWGQISDGIFENSRVGRIEEIDKPICEHGMWGVYRMDYANDEAELLFEDDSEFDCRDYINLLTDKTNVVIEMTY